MLSCSRFNPNGPPSPAPPKETEQTSRQLPILSYTILRSDRSDRKTTKPAPTSPCPKPNNKSSTPAPQSRPFPPPPPPPPPSPNAIPEHTLDKGQRHTANSHSLGLAEAMDKCPQQGAAPGVTRCEKRYTRSQARLPGSGWVWATSSDGFPQVDRQYLAEKGGDPRPSVCFAICFPAFDYF